MSRCDEQLEHMTAERDHWKRKAKEYAEQAEKLRDEVDRLEMYAQAFTGGAMKSLDESIARLQQERNAARASVEHIVTDISEYVEVCKQSQSEALEMADLWIGLLDSLYQQGELSHLTVALTEAARLIHNAQIEVYTMSGLDIVRSIDRQSIHENPALSLLTASAYSESAAQIRVGISYALQALGMEHVGFTADQIIRECHNTDEGPSISALERLPDMFISNLTQSPPKDREKLRQGLLWVKRWKASGKTREAFTHPDEKTIAERTLRTYVGWYNAIKSAGNLPVLKSGNELN